MKKCLQALKPAGSAGQLPRSLSEAHGVRSIAGSSDAWSSGSGGTYGGDPCHRRVLVENPLKPSSTARPATDLGAVRPFWDALRKILLLVGVALHPLVVGDHHIFD